MACTVFTGIAMTVATVTGDAGQLGTAAGFKGRLISWLIDRLSDRPGDGRFRGDGFSGGGSRGDRVWGDPSLRFRLLPGLRGGFTPSDRLSRPSRREADPIRRDPHPIFQHSVSQH